MGSPAKPQARQRPGTVHTSLYLPEPIYEALRLTAFQERKKINDIAVEGIELALRKRGLKH
jgi:hypothetical protein